MALLEKLPDEVQAGLEKARAGESGMVVTLVMPRQRRSTYSMLERAGVTPGRTEVRLGAPALFEITGAQTPSGIPIRIEEPPAPRRSASGYGDRGNSYGERGSYRGDRASVAAGDRGSYSGDRGADRGYAGAARSSHRPFQGAARTVRPASVRRDDRGPYRAREERPTATRREDRPAVARTH